MKSRGLLIALIISVGINLGVGGTFAYYAIRKANRKFSFKQWEKKYDETWREVRDSLDISPELAAELRAKLKAEGEATRELNKDLKPTRDSLLQLMKRPRLDTARLMQLLSHEEEVQKQIGYMLYTNLYETKLMLPEGKQDQFVDFFTSSVRFTGKPFYISTHKKGVPKKTSKD